MTSRLNPRQHWQDVLKPVKGYVEGYALDFTAPLADSQEFKAGALVHVNSDGKIEKGCGNVQMPMWAIYNSDAPSVQGDEGNITGGGMTALVATGGFEIYTTAYDKTTTYAPNDLLKPDTGKAGNITKATGNYNDTIVVGMVSQKEKTGPTRGGAKPQYGVSCLYLWTMCIPKVEAS